MRQGKVRKYHWTCQDLQRTMSFIDSGCGRSDEESLENRVLTDTRAEVLTDPYVEKLGGHEKSEKSSNVVIVGSTAAAAAAAS